MRRHLGAFLEEVALEYHLGCKHVQMGLQKKGSRDGQQELRWGAGSHFFQDSPGSLSNV